MSHQSQDKVEQYRSDAGLSPHQVALCTLLHIYLLPDSIQTPMEAGQRQALESLLLQKIVGGETAWQPSLMDMLDDVEDCLGNDHLAESATAAVLEQLAALSCPDDMLTFFAEISDMCQPGVEVGGEPQQRKVVDPASAIGIFIRRTAVSYSMLPFEGVCQLFTEVQGYLAQCTQAQYIYDLEPSAPKAKLQRRTALEGLLNREIGRVEQQLGRQSAEELGVVAADLQDAACDLPRAHLLRHTLALQQEDYLDALESLHRYFDYSAGPLPSGSDVDDSGQFQSALLSLGSMHTHFGHVQQALLALNETVRMAQQHSDDAALAHALAQLCRLLAGTTPAAAASASGDGSSAAHHLQLHRLLRRCLKRGKELQLPHLVAFARLALAQFTWQHRMIPPTTSTGTPSGKPGGLEDVEQAVREVAALHQSVTVAAAVPGVSVSQQSADGVPNMRSVADLFAAQQPMFGEILTGCEASSAAAVQQLVGSSHLLRSTAWNQGGSCILAQASAITFLACYADTARAEDACLAYAQLARLAAETRGFDAAAEVLEMADEEYPRAQDRQLIAARLAIGHQHALNRRDLHQAEHLASQIVALASPSGTQHLNLRMEGERRLVETLIARGRLEEAGHAARKHFAACVEAGLQGEAITLLLVLAKIHQQAGVCGSALPYALSCKFHAKQLGYDLLAAEAGILLADLELAINPSQAKRTHSQLLHLMPLVLGQGGQSLQARLHRSLADALLAVASKEELRAEPDSVLEHLSTAARGYEAQEDWLGAAEASYVASVVSQAAGLTSRRNKTAAAFQRFSAIAQSVY